MLLQAVQQICVDKIVSSVRYWNSRPLLKSRRPKAVTCEVCTYMACLQSASQKHPNAFKPLRALCYLVPFPCPNPWRAPLAEPDVWRLVRIAETATMLSFYFSLKDVTWPIFWSIRGGDKSSGHRKWQRACLTFSANHLIQIREPEEMAI